MSNLDNALADLKRQLRAESKGYLIKSWIGLYAQNVQLLQENENLKKLFKTISESSGSVETGSGGPEEKQSE